MFLCLRLSLWQCISMVELESNFSISGCLLLYANKLTRSQTQEELVKIKLEIHTLTHENSEKCREKGSAHNNNLLKQHNKLMGNQQLLVTLHILSHVMIIAQADWAQKKICKHLRATKRITLLHTRTHGFLLHNRGTSGKCAHNNLYIFPFFLFSIGFVNGGYFFQ